MASDPQLISGGFNPWLHRHRVKVNKTMRKQFDSKHLLYTLLRKSGRKHAAIGRNIEIQVETQLPWGGIGWRQDASGGLAEGDKTEVSNLTFVQKYGYHTIELTHPVIRQSSSAKKAWMKAKLLEMQNSMHVLAMAESMACHRDGTGALAKVDDQSIDTTLQLEAPAIGTVADFVPGVLHIEPGMRLSRAVEANRNAGAVVNGDGPYTVTAVDRSTNIITLDGVATILDNDYLYLADQDDDNSGQEPLGLFGIVSKTKDIGGESDGTGQLDRSANEWSQSNTDDSLGAFTTEMFFDAFVKIEETSSFSGKMKCITTPAILNKWALLQMPLRRLGDDPKKDGGSGKIKDGYVGLEFQMRNYVCEAWSDPRAYTGVAYLLDMEALGYTEDGPPSWMGIEEGNTWDNVKNSSGRRTNKYEASCFHYSEYFAKNFKSLWRGTGIT